MAWIESHQTLARHPKVVRLASALKINRAQAIGHLHLLWWWTLDFAPSGDLSAFTSCELGSAAEWPGKADGFLEALRQTGWLDGDMRVHDWHEYAGKLVEKRKADAERKRSVRRTSDGHPPDGARTAQVPYPTQPTQPNRTITAPEDDGEDLVFKLAGMDRDAALELLKRQFPDRDVWGQWLAFKKARADQGRKPDWKGLVAWLRKSAPVADLGRKKPAAAAASGEVIPDPELWPDYVTEHPEFEGMHFAQLTKTQQEAHHEWAWPRLRADFEKTRNQQKNP